MNYSIGTTLGGLVTLKSLGVPDPKHYFKFGSRKDTIKGSAADVGTPTITGHWGFVKQSWRDILRAYCTGASSEVYIITRCSDTTDEYRAYRAIMVWPEEEGKDAFRRIDFDIQFRQMVEVELP